MIVKLSRKNICKKPLVKRGAFCFLLLCSFVYCGDESSTTDSEGAPVIIIASGGTLATSSLTALAGESLSILNNDNSPHTITSQTASDAFDDSGTFDVEIPSDGVGILTLPADAASGTVFYFYCRYFETALSPSSGTITIE